MKRVLSLILALVLCLSLSACGKSEAVKNVEAMIEALGEITLESINAIRAAESAFNNLQTNEKEQVSNRQTLVEARDTYYELALVDNWCKDEVRLYEYDDIHKMYNEQTLVLRGDATATGNLLGETYEGTWSVANGQLEIAFDGLGDYGSRYTVVEEKGEISLLHQDSQWSLVREEVFHKYLDSIFLVVDMAEVDAADYFAFTTYDFVNKDAWGDPTGDGEVSVKLENKLYDQGWLILGASEDLALEIIWPEHTIEVTTIDEDGTHTTVIECDHQLNWTVTNPYTDGIHSLGDYNKEYRAVHNLSPEQITFGRTRGIMYFLKAEYATVEQWDHAWRSVKPIFKDSRQFLYGYWYEGLDY